MTITLTKELRDMLGGLTETVTVRDERGHVLGTLTPTPSKEEIDNIFPPLSSEEYERRLKGQRYSTREVLDRLDQLEG